MNIKRAKAEIRNTISAYLKKDEFGDYLIPSIRQRPVLLMGPPGIGKTQIMEQIAGECDLALVSYTITHHTRQSAIGLPFIKEKEYGGKLYSVTEYTMSEIIASVYDTMEASGKKEGILFIDEINCVSETLAPTMLQFLQCKSFGNQKVPEGWVIVAAGNPPEYNKSVREFDVVTLDRVKVMDVEADYPIWKEYAYQVGIHGSILSYLDVYKDHFYQMESTVDGKRFVTARGWQDLSEMVYAYEKLGVTMDQEVVIQYLQHPRIAKEFANYLELYYKYRDDYRIDEILKGTIRKGALDKLKFAAFDERLKVVGLLLARLSENFRVHVRREKCTDEIFTFLKTFKKKLDLAESTDHKKAADLFAELLESEKQMIKDKAAAGQNAKELKVQYHGVVTKLEQYEKMLRESDASLQKAQETGDEAVSDDRDVFELVRSEFEKEAEALEIHTEMTLEQLEYAFDFMEAAFGESREMVVFITELSVNSDAVKFLEENECPRYYMYNKTLLFEDRQADIHDTLSRIRQEMIDG